MKTKDMVIVAMFAAVIAVLGILPAIPIPAIGVPFTFQNLGIILAGCLLGRKLGGLSVLLFTVLVACGLPLLSGGRGGLALFFGPSGGYILSFPIIAYLIGWLTEKRFQHMNVWQVFLVNSLIGAFLCNLIGGTFMAFNIGMPLLTAYKSALVFLPGDLVKSLVAAFVAVKLRAVPSVRRYIEPGVQYGSR
ncbi:biotin transporter BioY [Macrococcus equipercicus]|uniref:Biotin transporter n=1 Tax=Macrococcus equipercicus TaxID=69967 RepID=A0A9Q9BQR5_9STAP|nr:biotin transporter BioY [Macrococcus equipercicus]UTH13951.1 biotin transporter BioY [Macrococcus equipercicus]